MRLPLLHSGRRDLLTSLLLVALLFRAYIPVGFMPASGAPFRLELCPAFGMSVPAHHLHHHDSRHHADLQDCPFGSAPAQGPVSNLLVFDPPGQIPFLDSLSGRTQAAGDSTATVSPTSRTAFSRLVSFRPTKRAWKRCIPGRARRPVWIFWGECHANCLRGPSTGPSLLFGLIARPERNAFTCNSHCADRASRCRCQ